MSRDVSVVIATRNRGPSIAATLTSVLAGEGVDVDIVVVDQSTDDATERAIRPLIDAGAPIIYERSSETGQSRAINRAVAIASGSIIAMTDDDCVVPPTWAAELAAAFAADPQIGVVFCDVRAGDHDPALGWVPDYRVHEEHLARTWRQRFGKRGMGAGMAARKSVLEAIGGFDAELGVGTPLHAANDLDVAARAMLAGWTVLESNRTHVVHHGFRTMEQGQAITRGWIGIGAMYAKLWRAGHGRYVLLGLGDVWSLSIRPAVIDAVRARKPRDLRRAVYFARGFLIGARMPVDRSTNRFVEGR